MERKDSLLGVLETLFRWKKPILIVCAAAAFGSAGISLLLSNYYQATTIFLAASPDQANPELLFNRSGALRIEIYGNENDIDRIMTIAQSQELVDFLVDSFDLYQHYDIDPDLPKASFHVRRRFFSLYDIQKTKRDAIELSIEDKDPEIAARMANAARSKIDAIAQELARDNILKTIQTYERDINIKSQQIRATGDTLAQLRQRFQVYNTESQTELVSQQISETEAKVIRDSTRLAFLRDAPGVPRDTILYLQAKVEGTRQELQQLRVRMRTLNEGIPTVQVYEKQYTESNQRLGENLERLRYWRAAYESEVPAILLVEAADVPIVKSRPRRSLIVLAATAVAFLFSALAVLLIDTYRDVDWRKIIQGGQ